MGTNLYDDSGSKLLNLAAQQLNIIPRWGFFVFFKVFSSFNSFFTLIILNSNEQMKYKSP